MESPPLPPPPPEVLSSPPKSPVASVQPTPRDLEEVLTRSTASSLEYHSGQRTSQLHILSTEEEVLQATPPSSPENKSSEVPPSISPSGIKLAGEVTAPEEIEVVKEQAENVDRAETAATGAEVEATSTPTAEAIGNSKDDESTTTSISQQSVGLQTQALNSTEVNSNMSRVTSRTPSTGSESLQNQVKTLKSKKKI